MDRVDDAQLLAVVAAARRAAIARGADHDSADDFAQEAMTRVLAAADRLETEAWLPYAVVVAGNLTVSASRQAGTARRAQHLLWESTSPDDPAYAVVASEQAAAVRAAVAGLSPAEQDLVVRHHSGTSTSELAEATGSTPGAVAARLARTRARLRLDYVLALRNVTLPSDTCRRVLLAISAGDVRRQQALDTSGHLSGCPVCPPLVEPLVRRRSGLAGIAAVPLGLLGATGGRIHAAVRNNPVQSSVIAGTATAVAVAAGVYAAASGGAPSRPAAAPPPVTATASPAVAVPGATVRTQSGTAVLPLPGPGRLRSLAGEPVVGRGAPVVAVVSHPGFWIGAGSDRIYVHIDRPELIRQPVRVGQKVSFTGRLVANTPDFVATQGVTTAEGLALLTRQGLHLTVDATALTVG